MTNQFEFSIPSVSGDPIVFNLGVGDVLYLLGANGTGKSSLVSRLFGQHLNSAKRISAHRQTWFQSNTLDMPPRNRQELESNIRSQDAQRVQTHARIVRLKKPFQGGFADVKSFCQNQHFLLDGT